jgi:hypothetical protein
MYLNSEELFGTGFSAFKKCQDFRRYLDRDRISSTALFLSRYRVRLLGDGSVMEEFVFGFNAASHENR